MFDEDPNEDDTMYNEYTIDDTLDSLTRLEKYHQSDFSLQRLVLVRDLVDTAYENGFDESVKRLLPIISKFVSDIEPAVRQVFAEQLFPLAKFFLEKNKEKGYQKLLDTFLPYGFELVTDKNIEVAQAGLDALIKLSQFVEKDDIEKKIFSVIQNFAQNKKVEENRKIGASLFNELAGVFGEKLIDEKVIDEIKNLSKDSAFSVRKQVAQSIGLLCKVAGKDLASEKLFPIFESLTNDDIWGVRKSCAESLPEISKYVNSNIRKNLVKIFETFSEDISRWVKMESFKQLGPFIATFVNEEVPKELIKHFIGMATQSSQNSDSDLVEYCAFNFPAVVLTVGKDNWSSLEKTFNLLVKDVQWKVRRSLSFSLHEIAKILGTKITEETLVPAFEVFLRDLDEVKIGVVSNMGKFMENLSEKTLQEYLKILEELPEETDNWRIREQVALQIPTISNIISPDLIHKVLVKVAISMMEDQYSDVRIAGLTCSGYLIKNLLKDESGSNGIKELTKYLTGLGKGNCMKRQMFLFALESIFTECDKTFVTKEFLTSFEDLSKDNIPNVRLTASKILANILTKSEQWNNEKSLLDIAKKLSKDSDSDVSFFIVNSKISLEDKN